MPAQGNPSIGARRVDTEPLPTRLNVRTLRADALHRLLLTPRGRVDTVDDIPRLGDLFSWPSIQVQVAIYDLCHDGRLAEDAHGKLIVRRRAAA